MSTARDPNEWMAEQAFNTLSGMGHEIFMYDPSGQKVYAPEKSDRMWSNTAKMMVTLSWTKGKPSKPLVTFHISDSTDHSMLQDIKHTLKQHNLYDHSFDTMPYGKGLQPRMFMHMNKPPEPVTEHAWTGSTRTSRWKTGLTEVVIRHTERLTDDQNPRRWCKVRDIFIHGADGSRYRMPQKHILGAKALAAHMDQSGTPWDSVGEAIQHVIQVLQQCRKMKNWAQQHMPMHVLNVDDLQDQIKSNLRCMFHPDHHAQAQDQIQNWYHTWHQTPCATHWPDSMQHALQALHAQYVREPDPESDATWPEQQALTEWFDQFDLIVSEDQAKKDVRQAQEITNSHDPRKILNHLNRAVTGWERDFEQDPKQVLDDILDTLENIKKSD